ncbi:MAG TPA: hypothetical protein VGV09_04015 [Steroidobacteraceae bacterium]|nr:hypothetical protein [Steroidobacteraceae bacterium]
MKPGKLRAITAAVPVIALLANAPAHATGTAEQPVIAQVRGTGAAAAPTAASTAAAARARSFATLPDWTGIWETAGSDAFPPPVPKLWGKPPYTAAAQQKYAPHGFPVAAAKNLIDVFISVAPTASGCQDGRPVASPGFPAIMEIPYSDILFELVLSPEQTLFVDTGGDVRHIYTDRPHPKPADLWPTSMGDSIGRWDGDTLVIDTIAREPGSILTPALVPLLPGIAELSEQAHFTERLRRIDADTLENRMTIEDPLRFTRPWQVTIHYARVKDVDRLIMNGCEHDRNPSVNGKFIVAPP